MDLVFKIGEFSIFRLDDGKYWVERKGGEGMECPESLIEQMILSFWEEHF